jgi:hypothetical protein
LFTSAKKAIVGNYVIYDIQYYSEYVHTLMICTNILYTVNIYRLYSLSKLVPDTLCATVTSRSAGQGAICIAASKSRPAKQNSRADADGPL